MTAQKAGQYRQAEHYRSVADRLVTQHRRDTEARRRAQ